MRPLTIEVQSGPSPSDGPLINSWQDAAGNIFGRAWRTSGGYGFDWAGLGRLLYDPRRRHVTAWPASPSLETQFTDTIAQRLQALLLHASGDEALHASAAVSASSALIFAGLGFAGKSTIAHAIGRRPHHHQLSDDATLLDFTETDVAACRLPFRPDLRPASAAHFGGPSPRVEAPTEARYAVAALVLLTQSAAADGPYWTVEPLDKKLAFSRVLEHAQVLDPTDRGRLAQTIERYLALVDTTPVYAVSYRPSFEALDDFVDAMLALAPNRPAQRG